MITLTTRNFETFKKEFLKWKEFFNLTDWETEFYFEDVEDIRACVWIENPEDHIVAVVLSKSWDVRPTAVALKRAALHECLELFLLRLGLYAMDRATTQTQINEETHRIIRCLENRFFPKDGETSRRVLL